jgi:hypothetical protein
MWVIAVNDFTSSVYVHATTWVTHNPELATLEVSPRFDEGLSTIQSIDMQSGLTYIELNRAVPEMRESFAGPSV